MAKNKKNNNPSNPPKKKKVTNTFSNSSVLNSNKGIYTYAKRNKPKRLGKDCIYFIKAKLTCNISKQLCRDAENCSLFANNKENEQSQNLYNELKYKKDSITDVGITAIVLSDNRKCTDQNHLIEDVQAKIRISSYPTGEISICEIPAAYCKQCDLYFILKHDFKKAKEIGVILCPVIDKTAKHIIKTVVKIPMGSESKIHQLGYNVIKNNGISDQQRQIILANIIENTNISKHEIKSCIERPMKQHLNQPNYAEAIKCWQSDLDFINNYQKGDCKEVIVEKIIIGKR